MHEPLQRVLFPGIVMISCILAADKLGAWD